MKSCITKLAGVLVAAPIFATTIAAVPAALAQPTAPFQQADKHEGVADCFAWSWADGNVTTTVYFHNRCSETHKILIWSNAGQSFVNTVAADEKGNREVLGTPHIEQCPKTGSGPIGTKPDPKCFD